MRTKNTNRQFDAALAKSQDKFRHTRPEWRLFERVLTDLGLDKRQVQIAEHAALQVGLVSGKKPPRRFGGIDKKDVNLDGTPSLPMPGGNGRFILPSSPFKAGQRLARRMERSHRLRAGWSERFRIYLKRR